MATDKHSAGDARPAPPLITRGLEALCAALLAAMVVLLFLQVFGRYVLQNPPEWTEELARAVFIYVTFIGGAIAIARGAHLRIDALHRALSRSGQLILDIGLIVAAVVFLAVVVVQSGSLIGKLSHQPMTSLPVSKAVFFAAVPVGVAVMLVYEVRRLVEHVRALARHREQRQGAAPGKGLRSRA